MSTKRNSMILSAAGIGWEIIRTLWNEVFELGGNDDNMRCVLSDKTLAEKLALVIMKKADVVRSCITYSLITIVDYTIPVEDVFAVPRITIVPEISSINFPVKTGSQKEAREIVLFEFDPCMLSSQILSEINNAGYDPANIWEIATLNIKAPGLKKEHDIVALGVSFDYGDRPGTICLCDLSGNSHFGSSWFEGDWRICKKVRFAAVRK